LDADRSTIESESLYAAIKEATEVLPTNPIHLFADYLPGAEILSAYDSSNGPCDNVEQ
jgi:hypothetical protein